MECTFEPAGPDRVRCSRCGHEKATARAPHQVHRRCDHAPPLAGARGLGDTIAAFTSALGIQPCGGCKQRQEWLNKLLPYQGKALDPAPPAGEK